MEGVIEDARTGKNSTSRGGSMKKEWFERIKGLKGEVAIEKAFRKGNGTVEKAEREGND